MATPHLATETQGISMNSSGFVTMASSGPRERTPFSPWPTFEPEEIEAATRVLRSGKVNYWTGEEGRSFEKEFARHVGVDHCVAVHNGTVALETGLHALAIGAGDEVVTTPRTFIASASAVVMRGAKPVFADVDAVSQNVTADAIARVLTPRTKAIIVVHLAGWPADMPPILQLAEERKLAVIEDCAQAHGAKLDGRSVGTFGHVNAWSFCQDKIMTLGGEGGAITTNDRTLWDRSWAYKDHGKSYDAVHNQTHPPGFRWLHHDFGTNARMLEVQAAIGRASLPKLAGWVSRRRENARHLDERFQKLPGLRVTVPPAKAYHSYYKYYVFVRPEALKAGWSRDRITSAVSELGVPAYSGSCSEIYLEKAFERHGLAPAERLPVARELGETSLMFLVHPTLHAEHIQRTAEAVERVMSEATR
jgi:dTDP-4-amino-4,6-dideoxygalactose transaminase